MISLGQLSKWYELLKFRKDRNVIAHIYGIDEKVLSPFLHHLTVIRNTCAHHSRLWNREFTVTMKIPTKPVNLHQHFNRLADRKIYNTLVMTQHLLNVICPDHHWTQHINQLINKYPHINCSAMGFPEKCRQLKPINLKN